MTMIATSEFADYKTANLFRRFQIAMQPMLQPVRWYRRRMMRKPGSTLGLTAAVLLGLAIVTNAVALQTDRHPAPIFTSLNAPAQPEQVAEAAVPLPVKRPVQADRKAEAPAAVPATRDGARPAARNVKDEPQRTASIVVPSGDQIGALISSVGVPAPATAPAPDMTRRAMLVQKALNKAGFGPLKADGSFGASSRQALEKFEASRKLPVKGELQGRTMRELARVSGIAIE